MTKFKIRIRNSKFKINLKFDLELFVGEVS
jgi:hypothetical protein